jgi:hypothetical protein
VGERREGWGVPRDEDMSWRVWSVYDSGHDDDDDDIDEEGGMEWWLWLGYISESERQACECVSV